MLSKTSGKRIRLLVLISVLSILLIASTAFAVTKLIKAKNGGVINVAPGILFEVPAGSLEADTRISVTMTETDNGIDFQFGPSGTVFDPPAKLFMTWQAIYGRANEKDAEGIKLYNEDGEELDVSIEKTSSGVVWYIPHFSIYYYTVVTQNQ